MSNTRTSNNTCRFCDNKISTLCPEPSTNVCLSLECQTFFKEACSKIHACGHVCCGLKNEKICLPCLKCTPPQQTSNNPCVDDLCAICFTDKLSSAPSVQLACGHIFHFHCTRKVLENRWAGPRISFAFSKCPICKNAIQHSALDPLLAPIHELYKDVQLKAVTRLKYEGLQPGNRFYQNPEDFAMDKYSYYLCFKCGKAYFGGGARCENSVLGDMGYDPAELVCGACSDVTRAEICPTHGTEYVEYKCRYCCSLAVYFCFGTTHFCNICHDNNARVADMAKNHTLAACPVGPNGTKMEGACPLQIKHSPTGEEYALGCGMCINLRSF